MSEVEFVKSKIEGRSGVISPYNADFVKELKRNVPSAKWNGSAWFFDDISRPDVEELVAKFFPGRESLQRVIITWNELVRDDPQIDGVSLATINRDWWNWKKNCPIQFKVVKADIDSGGSRKNPGLFGNLVIEAFIRPGASVKPIPDNMEVIENGKEYNPLEIFPTEDLVAELKRRDYDGIQ